MQFDSNRNAIVFVGQVIKIEEDNVIDHTTSMISRPPNTQREMELICAWINNKNINQSTLIDWPTICGSPVNEYTILELLDMVFLILFPHGKCD